MSKRLIASVRRLAAALARLERHAAAVHDLSVSQMRVLATLAGSPDGLRVSDLATDQGLAISTMTRNLALLEQAGLVARAGGTRDKRTIVTRLTDRGRLRAEETRRTTGALFTHAFAGFHPSDRVERAVAVDRVAAALEKVGAPAAWAPRAKRRP